MIKTVALVLVLWNPANDTEKVITIAQPSMAQCLVNEAAINADNSAMQIELNKINYEINETFCD